jgi:hypothetical protein
LAERSQSAKTRNEKDQLVAKNNTQIADDPISGRRTERMTTQQEQYMDSDNQEANQQRQEMSRTYRYP